MDSNGAPLAFAALSTADGGGLKSLGTTTLDHMTFTSNTSAGITAKAA